MALTSAIEAELASLRRAQQDAYATYIRLRDEELDLRRRMESLDEMSMLDAEPGYTILAEGDSWFDYPAIGIADVIGHLRSMRTNGFRARSITNLAHWGHESVQMMGYKQRGDLLKALKDPDEDYQVILFSAGGNDIVGEPFMLWIKDRTAGMAPEDGVDMEHLSDAIDVVRIAVEEFIDLCNVHRPGIPVLLQGYDFAIPDGRRFCPGVGPWLKPGLSARGWQDRSEGAAIVKFILERFNAVLTDIAAKRDHIDVVPTQGVLTDHDCWHNELHPNHRGFRQIAERFAETIVRVAPLPM